MNLQRERKKNCEKLGCSLWRSDRWKKMAGGKSLFAVEAKSLDDSGRRTLACGSRRGHYRATNMYRADGSYPPLTGHLRSRHKRLKLAALGLTLSPRDQPPAIRNASNINRAGAD